MPRKKRLSTLKHHCLVTIARNMALWCHDFNKTISKACDAVSPFYGLPDRLIQDLLDLLVTENMLERSHLRALLQPRTECLDLATKFDDVSPLDDELMEVILMKFHRLKFLHLSGCSQVSPQTLAQLPQLLPGLQVLRLARTRTSDAVLSAIGHHCHSLRELDVTYCSQVTDSGIKALCGDLENENGFHGCSKLHTLLVKRTSVTKAGALYAVEHLPALKHFSYLLDCCALYQHFQNLRKENCNRKLQLETLYIDINQWNRTEFPMALELAAELCPNVRNLQVEIITLLYEPIMSIVRFKHLRELYVIGDWRHETFSFETLASILQVVGPGLTSLALRNILDVDTCVIAKNCPNLEKFEVLRSSMNLSESMFNLTSCTYPFVHLSISCDDSFLGMSDHDLLHILSCCRELQSLRLVLCPVLTDRLINDLLKVNRFDHLLCLELVRCDNIHVSSILSLMMLENPLHTVFLLKCHLIADVDYRFLMQTAQQENLDINVVWFHT